MNKLRLWWYRKTKCKYSFDTPLMDEEDDKVIHDKILEISLRMKEIDDEMNLMKIDSINNKKKIRNLQIILKEKEDIIEDLRHKLFLRTKD